MQSAASSAADLFTDGLHPSQLQEVISTGDDAGFLTHKDHFVRLCLLGQSAPLSVVQQLLCVSWIISPSAFPDAELERRPNQRAVVQEILKQGVVMRTASHLSTLLKKMVHNPSSAGVVDPPEDVLHAVAALVGITQRFQLVAEEMRELLSALHICLQVLENHSINNAGGHWAQASGNGSSATLAGAPVAPRLRFPPGTPGALIEDTAYMLAVCIINALRMPQQETMSLWDRNTGRPNPPGTNSLQQDASLLNELQDLTRKTERSPPGSHVVDKIAHVGHGDKRSREEAAGYYAMVLIGVSSFLMANDDQEAKNAGAIALQMCCGSVTQLAIGSKVLAKCNWKGGVFRPGFVKNERDDGLLTVQFDDGEEEHVPAAHVALDVSLQLRGRGWSRVRDWFPRLFSCGLGTLISQDTLLHCMSTALDCWLAETMVLLVDVIIPDQQQQYRLWEESLRQADIPVHGQPDAFNDYAHPTHHARNMQDQQVPIPECVILYDVLKAIAFLVSPDSDDTLLQEREDSDSWRLTVVSDILEYCKPDPQLSNPRPGTAMFFRFVRKAHGAQGPITWLIESSPGRQGDLDTTCLAVLSAYLQICDALCMTDESCQFIFSMMQSDAEPPSTFHISLRFLITDPESVFVSQMADSSAQHGGQKGFDGAFDLAGYRTHGSGPLAGSKDHKERVEDFLCSAVSLISTFITRSNQVRNIVTQQPDLLNSCFTKLFTLLERPVSGRVVGQVFQALAAWCDGHDSAVHMWLKICRGGIVPYPDPAQSRLYNAGGLPFHAQQPDFFNQSLRAPTEFPHTSTMQTPFGMNDFGSLPLISGPPTSGQAAGSGLEYELAQERRSRRYPQTIGFLTLLLKFLNTINWRVAAHQELPLHELAAVYTRWIVESVFSRWDDQRYDVMSEKWTLVSLILRILRVALQIPDPIVVPRDETIEKQMMMQSQNSASHALRSRSPQSAVWAFISQADLLQRILSVSMERRERGRTGAIMDELLAQALTTINVILRCSKQRPAQLKAARAHQPMGKGVAQDVADWDNGGLVMKLASEEWHSITLKNSNPHLISQLCLLILLDLSQSGCRLSHLFIASNRGRPEDITRDAEEMLLTTAKATYHQMIGHAQAKSAAESLDRFVIRQLEAGVRVGKLLDPLKRHLIMPMEQAGMVREVAELRALLQMFVDNKVEKVQEVLAEILSADVADEVDSRRVLICGILQETLARGAGYYNLAHMLCGIPERYVEARTRGNPSMNEASVLRPYGVQRRTCLSTIVERLAEHDFAFVKANPVTATHFLRVLSCLASDKVVGKAVLAHFRSVNLVDKLASLLKEKLTELPLQPTTVPDASNISRQFSMCAAILQLAALELFTNQNTGAQGHHPLLLEGIRSLDMDSLPRAPELRDKLSVPLIIEDDNGVPRYNLEALEDQLCGSPEATEALQLAADANASFSVYPVIVEYVAAWCRLVDITLVSIEAEAEAAIERSSVAELDEILFQTLLTLVNRMSMNLSRAHGIAQAEDVVDALISKQRVRIDILLSRAALALVDTIHYRSNNKAVPARSAEQLGHLLRPLLQCLCDAEDKELRTNLYTVVTAFLYHVDSPSLEEMTDVQNVGNQHVVDKMQMRRACQDEFFRNPQALLTRLVADVSSVDSMGMLTTAAWTTLAKTIEWDEEEQLLSELHGSNLVSQHLANYDAVLCEILRVAGHGDTTGSQHLGGYQAFMSFLLAYASSPGGSRALTEHHGFLLCLTKCRFLDACGDSFPSTSQLMQQRCAQVALPVLRVVCTVVERLISDLSVIQQLQSLLHQHSRLFHFIMRRPFNLSKTEDLIDMPSLSLLETATRLLAMFSRTSAPCGKETPAYVQQFQLRSILAEFSSRATWTNKLIRQAPVPTLHVQRDDSSDLTKDAATQAVGGIMFNVLSCMRRVSDIYVKSDSFQPLFELTLHDCDGLSNTANRVDLTVLLFCLRDMFATSHHLLKTHPGSGSSHSPELLVRAAQVDAVLVVTHHSVAEALILLLYHLRGSTEPRFRNQAQQHLEPVLQETMDYVQTFVSASQFDNVTTKVMTLAADVVKIIAELLGVSVTRRVSSEVASILR
ncbi:hypothetical protein DIPPA_70032 [Diplonema papillatum]|nr:hypothetical protein DIPPA_70032 [Diplonema papillatum]